MEDGKEMGGKGRESRAGRRSGRGDIKQIVKKKFKNK